METVLKSIIDTGFADNCKEELLEFDQEGNLISRKPGVTSRGDMDGSFQMSVSGAPSVYNEEDQSVIRDDQSVQLSVIGS